MNINTWVDKEIMVYIFINSAMLLNKEKIGNLVFCSILYEIGACYAQWVRKETIRDIRWSLCTWSTKKINQGIRRSDDLKVIWGDRGEKGFGIAVEGCWHSGNGHKNKHLKFICLFNHPTSFILFVWTLGHRIYFWLYAKNYS